MPTLKLSHDEVRLLNDMFSCISDLGLFDDYTENEQDSSPDVFDKLWDKVTQLWSHFYYLITMTTFTINNKEYTHKELNLMWDFFTQDQWDHIISDIQDPEIASTIQELWRASY